MGLYVLHLGLLGYLLVTLLVLKFEPSGSLVVVKDRLDGYFDAVLVGVDA